MKINFLTLSLLGFFKAVGGMLGSFERSPLEGTEAFYRMSKLICAQKLSHLEVGNFSRTSYKKTDIIDILRYVTTSVSAPLIFVQMSWKLHQMITRYRGTKLGLFWKFSKLVILCQVCTKNGLKMHNLRLFFMQNWHKKASLILLLHMVWSSGSNFSSFRQILRVLDKFGVK